MSNLHISITSPSRELDNSPINQAITTMAAGLAQKSRNSGLPTGPALDLTFMLSSKEETPPFAGMRMGGYTSQGKTLFFEAAVPQEMGFSAHAPAYVAAILEDMVDNAVGYFNELGVAFNRDAWRDSLRALRMALDAGPKPH